MFWIKLDVKARYYAGEASKMFKQYLILLIFSSLLADCVMSTIRLVKMFN